MNPMRVKVVAAADEMQMFRKDGDRVGSTTWQLVCIGRDMSTGFVAVMFPFSQKPYTFFKGGQNAT